MHVDVSRIAKCRKGLSIVVMTLILLVISILLALIATLYAMDMTSGGMPIEDLHIHPGRTHIWHNETGDWWEAGFVVTNIGDTDASLYRIMVGGNQCAYSNVYYWKTNTVAITEDLNVTSSQLSGASYSITVMSESRSFTQASSDLTLKSGWTIVLYINIPSFVWTHNGWSTIKVWTNLRPYIEQCKLDTVY